MSKLKIFAVAAAVIGAGIVFLSGDKGHGTAHENIKPSEDKGFGKILIVYYSLTGNTREIALQLQEQTGAYMYAIQTRDSYRGTPLLYATSKIEMMRGHLPPLQNPMPDLSSYDTIFIGAPVWWFSAPPPLLSFLEQADLYGKKVVPFCTHGGNYGAFFNAIEDNIAGANILEGMVFEASLQKDPVALREKVSGYLARLDKHNEE